MMVMTTTVDVMDGEGNGDGWCDDGAGSADGDDRSEIVPMNKQYPLAQLIEQCKNFPGLDKHRRITFEYVMLKVIIKN